MTIKDHKDGKLITLSKPLDGRAKILNLCYFILFFLFAGFLMIKAAGEKSAVITFSVVVGSLLLVICFRFANKAMMSEQIYVDTKNIHLIKRGLAPAKKTTYEISLISDFRHLGVPETPKHPLQGTTTDYVGYQVQQRMIQQVNGIHRLAFDYNSRVISFGENIYSWEFEQIEGILAEFGYDDGPKHTPRAVIYT